MSEPPADALVFSGASGDLAYKKIFPALQAMVRRGSLDLPVIGVAKAGCNLEQRVQVDERITPAGDPERNLTQTQESLLARAPLHAVAGTPPVLDPVHLGLGPDCHTASLVPGDPALDVADADVALAGPYRGHRRMTLAFPAIDRVQRVLWVVTGAEKTSMLARLCGADRTIPAGQARQDRALRLGDRGAAAGGVPA